MTPNRDQPGISNAIDRDILPIPGKMMATMNPTNAMNCQDLLELWIDRQPIQDWSTDLAFSQNIPGKIPESGKHLGTAPGTGIKDVGTEDTARRNTQIRMECNVGHSLSCSHGVRSNRQSSPRAASRSDKGCDPTTTHSRQWCSQECCQCDTTFVNDK